MAADEVRGPTRPRRRVRRVAAAVGALAVVTLGVAGAAAVCTGAPSADATPSTIAVTTATVVRTSLTDARTMPGTVGYGAPVPVDGHGDGTVTWLPAAGAEVGRGKQLYRVDDRPVPVLLGGTPLFRTLSTTPPPGGDDPDPPTFPLEGRDVTVVADNLVALGYDIGPRRAGAAPGSTRYTAGLAAAVRHWQHDLGVPQTGALAPGDAVVLPGVVRVQAVLARLGDPVAEPLLALTATTRLVTVPVPAGSLGATKVGDTVAIVLPDGATTAAKVSGVAPATGSGQEGSGAGPGEGTVDVSVTPDAAAGLDAPAGASVQVRFAATTHPDVLAVPVDALLALAGGGYALQRPDGSLVAVTTALFADGLVEVAGSGVREGLTVVRAS